MLYEQFTELLKLLLSQTNRFILVNFKRHPRCIYVGGENRQAVSVEKVWRAVEAKLPGYEAVAVVAVAATVVAAAVAVAVAAAPCTLR